MSGFQKIVLSLLALMACGILATISVVGLAYLKYSSVQNPESPIPVAQIQPSPTFVELELPTAQPTALPTPSSIQNPVIVYEPTTPNETSNLSEDMASFFRGQQGKVQANAELEKQAQELADQSNPQVNFWADRTNLTKGECTNLNWQVTGVAGYSIDGKPGAGSSGTLHLCPKGNETHVLEYQAYDKNNLLRGQEVAVTIGVSSKPEPAPPPSNPSSGGQSSGGVSSSCTDQIPLIESEYDFLISEATIDGDFDSVRFWSNEKDRALTDWREFCQALASPDPNAYCNYRYEQIERDYQAASREASIRGDMAEVRRARRQRDWEIEFTDQYCK